MCLSTIGPSARGLKHTVTPQKQLKNMPDSPPHGGAGVGSTTGSTVTGAGVSATTGST